MCCGRGVWVRGSRGSALLQLAAAGARPPGGGVVCPADPVQQSLRSTPCSTQMQGGTQHGGRACVHACIVRAPRPAASQRARAVRFRTSLSDPDSCASCAGPLGAGGRAASGGCTAERSQQRQRQHAQQGRSVPGSACARAQRADQLGVCLRVRPAAVLKHIQPCAAQRVQRVPGIPGCRVAGVRFCPQP